MASNIIKDQLWTFRKSLKIKNLKTTKKSSSFGSFQLNTSLHFEWQIEKIATLTERSRTSADQAALNDLPAESILSKFINNYCIIVSIASL